LFLNCAKVAFLIKNEVKKMEVGNDILLEKILLEKKPEWCYMISHRSGYPECSNCPHCTLLEYYELEQSILGFDFDFFKLLK